MHIAIVIENYLPHAGGNERSTEQIARRLLQRDHRVTVLTNDAPATPEPLAGGQVIAAHGPAIRWAWGLWRFRRWAIRELERGGYDVSLSMTNAVPAAVMQPRGGLVRETAARNVGLRRGGAARALKRATLALNLKQRALLHAERRALTDDRVRKIVAISAYVEDQLAHHYRVPAGHIASIPNGAEIESLIASDRARTRARLRRALELKDEHVVFLFAAMNPKLKGLAPLLRALARLRPLRPEARLLIAGPPGYALHRRIAAAGLGDAVRVIGPTRCMDALYVSCDATILPTFYDPSSKVVLESLLHDVPAISTLHNGASQWIFSPSGARLPPSAFDPVGLRRHSLQASCATRLQTGGAMRRGVEQPAGRVVNCGHDIDALVQAMSELCDDEERARCAAATRGLDGTLSMDAHVDRLEALLREVAEEKGGAVETAGT